MQIIIYLPDGSGHCIYCGDESGWHDDDGSCEDCRDYGKECPGYDSGEDGLPGRIVGIAMITAFVKVEDGNLINAK